MDRRFSPHHHMDASMRLKDLYPACACAGTTKKGAKCGTRDIFQNGFCRYHGGEGRLVREIRNAEKQQLKTKRLLARTKKLDRMLGRMTGSRTLNAIRFSEVKKGTT